MSRQTRVHRPSVRLPSFGASRAGHPGSEATAALQRAADRARAASGLLALQRIADARAAPAQRMAEEEEPLQAKLTQRVQEEEEPLQAKALQRSASPAPATGAGLPPSLKAGAESLSGVALDDVRVHRNSPEPAAAGALAFAQGNEVHLAPGQEKHLPHEAWHVVQQRQGRVAPTAALAGGVPLNDDPALEKEADVMGAKALAAAPTGIFNL
jgi:Domain of unknown function (DUF4157)